MATHKNSVFIFRRDLRLEDNTSLIEALKNSEKVIPAFIFNPDQVGKVNEYKSNNGLQFMIECLLELNEALKEKGSQLYCFEGKVPDILDMLVKDHGVDAIYLNQDYTPFSVKRDNELKEYAEKIGINFHSYEDCLLLPVETILSNSGKPYTIFTHFGNKVAAEKIPKPKCNDKSNYYAGKIAEAVDEKAMRNYYVENPNIFKHGGRSVGLEILKNIEKFKKYPETRSFPSTPTTGLSAFNKFGPVSIREVYHSCRDALGANHDLVKQLIWRDFFYTIMHYNPTNIGNSMNKTYQNLPWIYDEEKFKIWCEGKTGFPFVDAGMREMNASGWMHNRTRMVVSNFLTKDLLMDWKLGEKYFAQKLVDYDPCLNNGNWQWNAGTGTDPEKYGGPRIFNPWLQSAKYDPDAVYIKKWVPELKSVPAKAIHEWHKNYDKCKSVKYPKPIVDHPTQRDKCLKMFKLAKQPVKL